MECVSFLIFLAVLKESNPLNPDIHKYDQYMKDFEATGRQIKQHAKDKMTGSVMKRESPTVTPNDSPEKDYSKNAIEVEKLFRKFHPETKNLSGQYEWAEALTPESLKRICDEMLEQLKTKELANLHKEYRYNPVNETYVTIVRVVRDAPFYSFLKKEREELTVAICSYDKTKFYFTPADDKNVFRLCQDPHGTFILKSGLHPVHFK